MVPLVDELRLTCTIEQNLRSHISASLSRRQGTITSLVRRYNTLCEKMRRIVSKKDRPRGAVAPRPIKLEGLFKLDVDHDIWQEHGFGDVDDGEVPRWLSSEAVREGIRCQLELDRCDEELERLSWERCALQEWFKREWQSVEDVKLTGA